LRRKGERRKGKRVIDPWAKNFREKGFGLRLDGADAFGDKRSPKWRKDLEATRGFYPKIYTTRERDPGIKPRKARRASFSGVGGEPEEEKKAWRRF
jgi:hypothetical protein